MDKTLKCKLQTLSLPLSIPLQFQFCFLISQNLITYNVLSKFRICYINEVINGQHLTRETNLEKFEMYVLHSFHHCMSIYIHHNDLIIVSLNNTKNQNLLLILECVYLHVMTGIL